MSVIDRPVGLDEASWEAIEERHIRLAKAMTDCDWPLAVGAAKRTGGDSVGRRAPRQPWCTSTSGTATSSSAPARTAYRSPPSSTPNGRSAATRSPNSSPLALLCDIERDEAFLDGYRQAGGTVTFDAATRRRLTAYRSHLDLIMLVGGDPCQLPASHRQWLHDEVRPHLNASLDALTMPCPGLGQSLTGFQRSGGSGRRPAPTS